MSVDAASGPIVRQAGGLLAGRVGAALLSAAWFVVAARGLSVDDLGRLVLLGGLAAVAAVGCDLGVPWLVTSRVALRGGVPDGMLAIAVRRRLVAAAVATLCLVVAYDVAIRAVEVGLPALMGVSMAATCVYSTVTAAQRGLGIVTPDALNELFSRAAVVAGGIVVLAAGAGLTGAVAVYAGADLASAAVLWRLRRRLPSVHGVDAKDVSAGSGSVSLGAAALLGSLYYRVDLWLLTLLGSANAVAFYGAAYRLVDGGLIPAGALAALILAQRERWPKPARHRQTRRLVAVVSVAVATGSFVAGLGAWWLTSHIFGGAYGDSVVLLRILLVSAPPTALVIVLMPVLAALDRRAMVRVFGLTLVVNVVANVIAIPRYGASGAAWAAVGSQCLLAALVYGSWAVADTSARSDDGAGERAESQPPDMRRAAERAASITGRST